MKQYPMYDRKIVMQNEHSLHNYFAWPTVARLRDGRIAVVASGFRLGHVCPTGKAVMALSDDECESFTLPTPVIDTLLDDRDAGICPFGKSGVIVTSFNNALAFQEKWCRWREGASDTLTEAQKEKQKRELAYIRAYLHAAELDGREEKFLGSVYRISHDNGRTFGELYHAPVTSPHGPCVTPDGRILYVGKVFDGKEAQCWELDGKGGSTFLSAIPHVADRPENMADYEEPHAIALPNGKIIVHIRQQYLGANPLKDGTKLFRVLQSESTDGGKSFSLPHPICDRIDVGAPACLLRHSSGILISTVSYRTPPYGINALISRDDGESWETASLLSGEPNADLGYPSTVELSDGTLFTVWYSHTAEDKQSPSVIYGAKWRLE